MGLYIKPGDTIILVLPTGAEEAPKLLEKEMPGVRIISVLAPDVQPDVIAVYREDR